MPRGLAFTPGTVAPYGTSSATEVIDGQGSDQEITETVTVQLGDGSISELSDGVVVAACEGPPVPPEVTFTFTKTASTSVARVGDTVEYTYCGQNTSDIPLEVVRLVDDRLGVVIELPDVETVVAPGETLCNTDVGQPVTYTVTQADVDTIIVNSAVVTVRTLEDTPREFQAVAATSVAVPLPARLLALLATEDGRSWVCHATGGPHWNKQEVSVSSLGEETGGHNDAAHQGGQDIVPPGPWDPNGRNWNPDNEGIWLNGCGEVVAVPVNPTVTQATCSGGVVTRPTVVAATRPLGVHYTLSPSPPYDGTRTTTVTVTATLTYGYTWGQMPAGWNKTTTTATYTVTLNPSSCDVVTPANPTVTQASCAAGILNPSLVFPQTDGVVYTTNPLAPYKPATTVTVTATLSDAGRAWPATLPSGWTRTSNTTATHQVVFVALACIPVAPVTPTVTQATCVNGAVTTPRIDLANTPGISYVALPPAPYGYDGTADKQVSVRALLQTGYTWSQMPTGWFELSGSTAIYDVVLKATSCQAVTPAAPTVTQAVCKGGVLMAPILKLSETQGITYTASPLSPYVAGQSVTVTATLSAGGAWPGSMPTGWTRTTDTTATFTVKFDTAACTPVSPVQPVVTQATCSNGVVTTPTIDLVVTSGVFYERDPRGPYNGAVTTAVTVTAKVLDGFAWGQVSSPWTRVSDVTATMNVTLNAASCTQVLPVAPTVLEAKCRNGAIERPLLSTPVTTGITYTVAPAGPYSPGQSVTVTATLAGTGVAWPDDVAGGVDGADGDDGDVHGEV